MTNAAMPGRRAWLVTLALCLATGQAAHILVDANLAPAIFWPPAGIALGAALIWGLGTVSAAFLAVAALALQWGAPWPSALLLGAATAAQAVAGTLMLRRVAFPGILPRILDLANMVLYGGLLGGIVGGIFTFLSLREVDWFWEGDALRCAVSVVLAHLLAVLVFAPILICRSTARCPKTKGSRWEAYLVLGLLLLSAMSLAHPSRMGLPEGVFRPYPLLPFLLWLAMRANPRFTGLGLAVVYAVAASTIGWGQGHLFLLLPDSVILPIHGFMFVIGVTFMALAVLMVSRSLAENALRASEARLRNVIGLIRNCLWETDAQGRFIYLDSHADSVFFQPASRLLGHAPEEVWPEGLGPELRALFNQTANSNAPEMAAQTLTGPDGTTIFLETNCVPLRDDTGRRLGWQGITRDVTERMRMIRNLDDTNRRFRQLAENIQEVFWISDRAFTRFDYLSPLCLEVYGVPREELLRDAKSRLPAILQEDMPGFLERLQDVIAGKPVDVDFRIQHPRKGLRWIRSRSFPFEDIDGKPMTAGIVEDITDRKQAEHANMVEALAQRDALIREVHHRIKNNLQTVVGLLRREAGKHPEAKPAIEAAIAQVQSVAVVHGLHGRVTQHTIMLCELLPAIVNSVSDLTGVPIRREGVSEGCGALRIKDSETVAVALILNELATNAVKHAPPVGGVIAPPLVAMTKVGAHAHILLVNRARLPEGFDFARGAGLGTGLGLVRALMPTPGLTIDYRQRGDNVEVEVVVEPPVLIPLPEGNSETEMERYEKNTDRR